MVALSRNLANKHAMEMLLTGDMVPASRAAEMGLVNQVVPSAELRAASMALAGKIAAKSSLDSRHGQTCLLPAKRNGFGGGLQLCFKNYGRKYVGA